RGTRHHGGRTAGGQDRRARSPEAQSPPAGQRQGEADNPEGGRRASQGLRGVHGVRLLLDTHAFLWFLLNDPQLSARAEAVIVDPLNPVEVSPATYWEIAIKIRLGRYALPEPYQTFMEREIADNDFRVLPIGPRHTAILTTMPLHHRDPFDRLLVAQASIEGI